MGGTDGLFNGRQEDTAKECRGVCHSVDGDTRKPVEREQRHLSEG